MSFKLTAINRCLRAIGESPVNSITSSVPDAVEAKALVEEVTKEVLSAGWHSNTNKTVTITPDVNGNIVVPSEWIAVDTTYYSTGVNVTVRQEPTSGLNMLYHIDDQTFVFTHNLYCDIVVDMDIDEVPYAIQNYIGWHAARRFQEGSLSSLALDQMLVEREAIAWGKLLDFEAEQDDVSILRGSLYMRTVTSRNNLISGY